MLNDLIKASGGLFILYLIILGNYTNDVLGCRVQRFFSDVPFAKHLVCIFTIYFFINLSTDKIVNPSHTIVLVIIMYILFLLSRDIPIEFFSCVIISLFIIKILEDYKMYKKRKNDNSKLTLAKIELYQKILTIFVLCNLIIGFYIYTNYQMKKYKKDFSWVYHIIGRKNYVCDSLVKGGKPRKSDKLFNFLF